MLPPATTMNNMFESEHEIEAVSDDATKLLDSSTNAVRADDSKQVDHKSKLRVHFPEDFKEVKPTLHILGYTLEEKRQAWYNLEDLEQIKKARRRTTKCMSKGTKFKKGQCTRGLEGYTKETSKIRRQLISSSVEAVIAEQFNQEEQNKRDVEQIAQMYGIHTLPCQLAAYEQGLIDHAAIDESENNSAESEISEKIAEYTENAMEKDSSEERDEPPSNAFVSWQRT